MFKVWIPAKFIVHVGLVRAIVLEHYILTMSCYVYFVNEIVKIFFGYRVITPGTFSIKILKSAALENIII